MTGALYLVLSQYQQSIAALEEPLVEILKILIERIEALEAKLC